MNKILCLYNRTLRRLSPLHNLLRAAIWKGGDISVCLLSIIRQFELPSDKLLPLFKMEMLIGTYESETVQVCKRLIRPGMTVIDIGAHAGYYTLIFAKLVGTTGRVFAFEPHPINFEILKRNVQKHHLKNVVLLRKAVSNKDDHSIFYEAPLSMGHSLLPVKSYIGELPIETVSIDNFLVEAGVKQVDFIKMDVEGGEPEVLDGMEDLAKHSRKLFLILEFKPSILSKRKYDPSLLIKKLFSMGFEVFFIKNSGKYLRLQPDGLPKLLIRGESGNLIAQK